MRLSLNYMKFPNLNNLGLVKLLFKIIFFVAVIFNVHAAEIDLTKKLREGAFRKGAPYETSFYERIVALEKKLDNTSKLKEFK